MSFKNSSEWLGEIPKNWTITKFGRITDIISGNSIKDNDKDNYTDPENAIPYIATKDVEVGTDVINYDNGMYIKENDLTFKRAYKDDILMCIEGGSAGRKISYLNQEVCYINKLARFNVFNCNSKFFYYYLKSPSFKEEFKLNLSGLIGGVSIGKLKGFSIALPDTSTQQKIVDLLDVKCSEIDKIKKGIEITINDYKNIRKSIILETLLNGFNEKNDFKDSNITWIGRIPSHYKVVKIKHLCRLKGRIGWQGLKTNDYVDVGPYLITGTDFEKGYVNWKTCVHITESRYIEDENIHIYEDDLLITKDGTIGKLAIVKKSPEKVSLNSGVLLIRSNQKFEYDTKYLYYTLLSEIFWKWYNLNQTGNSTIKHLYQEQFYDFSFPLPPIEEQKEIVTYLDDKCNEIDNLINNKQEILKELELYKQSLIFEYVTGKKEV